MSTCIDHNNIENETERKDTCLISGNCEWISQNQSSFTLCNEETPFVKIGRVGGCSSDSVKISNMNMGYCSPGNNENTEGVSQAESTESGLIIALSDIRQDYTTILEDIGYNEDEEDNLVRIVNGSWDFISNSIENLINKKSGENPKGISVINKDLKEKRIDYGPDIEKSELYNKLNKNIPELEKIIDTAIINWCENRIKELELKINNSISLLVDPRNENNFEKIPNKLNKVKISIDTIDYFNPSIEELTNFLNFSGCEGCSTEYKLNDENIRIPSLLGRLDNISVYKDEITKILNIESSIDNISKSIGSIINSIKSNDYIDHEKENEFDEILSKPPGKLKNNESKLNNQLTKISNIEKTLGELTIDANTIENINIDNLKLEINDLLDEIYELEIIVNSEKNLDNIQSKIENISIETLELKSQINAALDNLNISSMTPIEDYKLPVKLITDKIFGMFNDPDYIPSSYSIPDMITNENPLEKNEVETIYKLRNQCSSGCNKDINLDTIQYNLEQIKLFNVEKFYEQIDLNLNSIDEIKEEYESPDGLLVKINKLNELIGYIWPSNDNPLHQLEILFTNHEYVYEEFKNYMNVLIKDLSEKNEVLYGESFKFLENLYENGDNENESFELILACQDVSLWSPHFDESLINSFEVNIKGIYSLLNSDVIKNIFNPESLLTEISVKIKESNDSIFLANSMIDDFNNGVKIVNSMCNKIISTKPEDAPGDAMGFEDLSLMPNGPIEEIPSILLIDVEGIEIPDEPMQNNNINTVNTQINDNLNTSTIIEVNAKDIDELNEALGGYLSSKISFYS